jgi:hypothetical protein
MKKLLVFICFLLMFDVKGQDDQILLYGRNAPIPCRIIEVSKDSITWLQQNGKLNSVEETSNVTMIKLFTSADTAAYTTQDLFAALADQESYLLTWYGIDFSFVRICQTNAQLKYSNSFFQAANEKLLFTENSNTDPPIRFPQHKVNKKRYLTGFADIDLSYLNKVNDKIILDRVFDCKPASKLPLDSIRTAILSYGMTGSKKGIGAVVFYRQINKERESCSVYITFFDIHTGTVLFVLQQEIKGGGMTLEWHWVSKLLPVLNKLRNSYGNQFNSLKTLYGIE